MATGNDFIIGALRKIEINAAESAIESYETADALDVLNDMMAEFEPILKLGYKPILNATDTVRVPRHTHSAIKTNLAVHLLTEYGKPITPALSALANSTMNNLLDTVVSIDTNFPNTLPQGSGNECNTQYMDDKFFPTPSKDC